MSFTGMKSIFVAAALLTAACVAETPEVGESAVALGNVSGLPSVEDGDLGALPPCSSLAIDTTDCSLFVVEGSGGLYALECDGIFVCIGDAEDLAASGEPPPPAPGEVFLITDGTPIPAVTHVADGTPIPASAVADGTPIPATPSSD